MNNINIAPYIFKRKITITENLKIIIQSEELVLNLSKEKIVLSHYIIEGENLHVKKMEKDYIEIIGKITSLFFI